MDYKSDDDSVSDLTSSVNNKLDESEIDNKTEKFFKG